MKNLVYPFLRFISLAFFKTVNRLEVMDAHKVPQRGGVIVASNHLSYLDPPIMSAALRRPPVFAAKESLFSMPLVGRLISSFALPVRRGRPLPSTIKEAVRRLENGEVVVIFPEGGLTADGSRLEAKRGVGLIASMFGAPVVPARIVGTERALPVGSWLIRPFKVRVAFGEPIEVKRGGRKEEHERITRDVMVAIENLQCGRSS